MRGIYVYLAGAIAVLAAIAGAGYKGYSLGKDHVRAEYATRDLAASEANASKFRELETQYREKERAATDASAAISQDYQKRIANAEKTKTLALNAVRAVGLRDPGTSSSPACGSASAATAGTSSGRDGTATADVPKPPAGLLSVEASQFLVSLAGEADAVAIQLGACQDVLESERK